MTFSLRAIVHPSDFSDAGGIALAHALRIALAARSGLRILHVTQPGVRTASTFPDIRKLAVQWGLAKKDDPPWEFWTKLGIDVDNVRLDWQEPTQGVLDYLGEPASDFLVLATHGRDGVEHWLKGSVAETVSRRSAIPTLFITRGARGFVDQASGVVKVRSALVPVDVSPAPGG